MIRSNRFFGGILLIAGTSIGAGMLLIPVLTGFCGFIPSFILLILCWMFMLLTAYLFLEVNLFYPGEINIVTMSQKTLGSWGKGISWIVYLLLLYSLTAAYISASSPVFYQILTILFGHGVPAWAGPFPLLIIFGIFIYLGTKPVDYINRLLMLGLVVAYVMLVFFLPSHVQVSLLSHIDWTPMIIGIPIIITSFGYHIIIPSITTYMKHDAKKLRWMIFVGSSIPFFVYLLWQFLVLGVVPLTGDSGLLSAWIKGSSATEALLLVDMNRWIISGAHAFAFFAVLTSFLGVSLSLADFLRDGLKIKKTNSGRFTACLLTFLPPLVFVYGYQKAFFSALEYAGVFVAILLAIFPSLMNWFMPKKGFFQSFWGRIVLILVILIACFIIVIDILQKIGYLNPLLTNYLPKR